jgi:hypothetical protein
MISLHAIVTLAGRESGRARDPPLPTLHSSPDGAYLAGCDFDVQIADFRIRHGGIVVSLEREGDGFDHLAFGFVSRIGAAHDPKARNPKAPVPALGVVSIFNPEFHDHFGSL